jgi:hypothetical protein
VRGCRRGSGSGRGKRCWCCAKLWRCRSHRHPPWRHHIRTAAFFAHVSIPPFVQINAVISPALRRSQSLRSETGLFVFLRRARQNAFLGSTIFIKRCVLSGCISLLFQRAIPNLWGASRSFRDPSFVPLKWGSDAAIPARHVVCPLADHQEFRCCNVWSTSDLSCGHLSKNRVNGAPAFGGPTASR